MQSNHLIKPPLQNLVKALVEVHKDNVHCPALFNPLCDLFKKLYQICEAQFSMLTIPNQSVTIYILVNPIHQNCL